MLGVQPRLTRWHGRLCHKVGFVLADLVQLGLFQNLCGVRMQSARCSMEQRIGCRRASTPVLASSHGNAQQVHGVKVVCRKADMHAVAPL